MQIFKTYYFGRSCKVEYRSKHLVNQTHFLLEIIQDGEVWEGGDLKMGWGMINNKGELLNL